MASESAGGLQKFFDQCPEEVSIEGSLHIRWSMPGVGFGEYYIYKRDDGGIGISNECMRKDSIKNVLNTLVDKAVLDDTVE